MTDTDLPGLDLLPAVNGRDSDWAAHAAQPWFSLS
jgi:hypothetical protein